MRNSVVNQEILDAFGKLEFLVVVDGYNSPFARIANVHLPLALNLEKDGTFTNYDRTVQRVRAAVPALGESHDGLEIIGAVADRMGYHFPKAHPSQVMNEIATVVPGYAGVSYARLERGGIVTPVDETSGDSATILGTDRLAPKVVSLSA
jgi:predicted molibdopterin-dependent oxidoreductase YjgC